MRHQNVEQNVNIKADVTVYMTEVDISKSELNHEETESRLTS